MAFSGSALLQLAAELTSPLDLSTATSKLNRAMQITLTEGAGANQANRIWHDQRTLAASATEDLDLSGVLTDPFGAVITMARVKLLFISAAADNTNNVVVGAAAATPWNTFLNATGTATLRPGGWLAAASPDATGWATAGGELLKVANSAAGSTVTYEIVVIGAAT